MCDELSWIRFRRADGIIKTGLAIAVIIGFVILGLYIHMENRKEASKNDTRTDWLLPTEPHSDRNDFNSGLKPWF